MFTINQPLFKKRLKLSLKRKTMILRVKSESEKGSRAKTKKSKHVDKSKETLTV